MNTQAPEMKKANKLKIARFILEKGDTSKAEIAASLGLSMPTTLAGIKELSASGVVIETGIYASTGGRKAKALSINPEGAYALGISITANHLQLVLINLRREMLAKRRIRLGFSDSAAYDNAVAEHVHAFVVDTGIDSTKICGAGISVPGLMDAEQLLLLSSHALGDVRRSFAFLAGLLPWPVTLEEEAYAAFASEYARTDQNLCYLSLGTSVSGAVRIGGTMYRGLHGQSARFGHMIIKRGGRSCYCGREGCAEGYLSTRVLEKAADSTMEGFFAGLADRDSACQKAWNKYAESLAVTVSNLHMLYDCDVVLGGSIGGFLEDYRGDIVKQLRNFNKEEDTDYVKTGRFHMEAPAYGISCQLIEKELVRLCRME